MSAELDAKLRAIQVDAMTAAQSRNSQPPNAKADSSTSQITVML